LDSSKSSDRRAPPAGESESPRVADRGRFRGHRGGVINMHRALARYILGPLDLLTSALMVVLFSFLWIVSLPWLCRMWRFALALGLKFLALNIGLGLREHRITPFIRFSIPYPRMEGFAPDTRTWWVTASVVIAIYAASYFFPQKWTPVTYLLRAVLFIQATALAFFLWAPARFPHTPDSYMEGIVSYTIALISFVPILFGLTYYIFDFGLIRKTLLTAMTMSHLSLFLPLQILLQAAVLHKSILFMPVLYIVFGLPVDVLIILAFYSWGMSWPAKIPKES
jgi:hypothetical protein